ncbi:class I SAM-dependent methyltransferase [Vibrio sp. E150_011]
MNEREVLEYYKKVFSNGSDRHNQMQKLFPDTLADKGNILDYGCGWGGISDLFVKKYNANVDAVDISKEDLELAKNIFHSDNINFIHLENFDFPIKKYDLIFSSQVIEHVHNPGNYLNNISNMLKDDSYLLIGLPNGCNVNIFLNQVFMTKSRLIKHSQKMLAHYDKAHDHINMWDMGHFTTLVASCGFEVVDYLPTEGTPVFNQLLKIPFIGKYLYRIPFLKTNMSYTMFFLLKKKRDVFISNNA